MYSPAINSGVEARPSIRICFKARRRGTVPTRFVLTKPPSPTPLTFDLLEGGSLPVTRAGPGSRFWIWIWALEGGPKDGSDHGGCVLISSVEVIKWGENHRRGGGTERTGVRLLVPVGPSPPPVLEVRRAHVVRHLRSLRNQRDSARLQARENRNTWSWSLWSPER